MPITSLDFRRALGQFATGVTVVTVQREARAVHGMTANSFTSVSLDPPLVSVCVDQRAHLLPLLLEKRFFGVNILREEQQRLSEFFSRPDQSEREEQRMHVDFQWTPDGIPLLGAVLCQMACRLHAAHPAGDHTIVVAEVLSASLHGGLPLLFFQGRYTRLHP